MVRQVFVACLLVLTVLGTCAVARPHTGSCREARGSSTNTLQRLLRRSAAIASSLRNLRYIRERRWSSSYPVWKSLRKVQERAMDISNLPPQPVPDEEETARDFAAEHAALEKDLNTGLGDIEEGGFWHHQPFVFPELTKPSNDVNAVSEEELKPETVEGWGSVEGWGPMDYGNQPAEEPEESFGIEWGSFLEPCSDDIVGNPCTWHSDCHGCREVFHCSESTCVAGPEPDPFFDGFI